MTAMTMSDVRRTAPWMVLALFAGAVLMTIFLLVTAETEPVRMVTMQAPEEAAPARTIPSGPEKPDAPASAPMLAPALEESPIQLDEVRVAVPRGTARGVLRRSTPATFPERPDRADVVQALEWTRDLARSCVEGTAYEGRRVDMHVHVSPNGAITIAEIEGDLAGTEAGSCIARAVRRAALPRFSGEPLVVRYPLQL